MLNLEVYFDETGHGDDLNLNFFGIAGCMEKAETWVELEPEWNAILNVEGLTYFHMNEFAHSIDSFKKYRGDEIRRRKLYGDLWNLIHKAEPIVIGCFVDLEGYRGRLGEGLRNTVGDVYFMCFFHCLKFAAMLVQNQSMSNISIGSIATIFDEKKGFKGKAMGIYEYMIVRFPELQDIIPPPIFRDMRKVSPIQVADIIAYEAHKEFSEQSKGESRTLPRWGFGQLKSLYARQTNRTDYPFGDVNSQFAFYSQSELARITLAYDKQFGNKELE